MSPQGAIPSKLTTGSAKDSTDTETGLEKEKVASDDNTANTPAPRNNLAGAAESETIPEAPEEVSNGTEEGHTTQDPAAADSQSGLKLASRDKAGKTTWAASTDSQSDKETQHNSGDPNTTDVEASQTPTDKPPASEPPSTSEPAAAAETLARTSAPVVDRNKVYLYTSLAGYGIHIVSDTNRLQGILKAYKIDFELVDLGTNDRAKRIWRYRGQGRKLPAVVRDDEVKGVSFSVAMLLHVNFHGEMLRVDQTCKHHRK
jgi:hypothetical protein